MKRSITPELLQKYIDGNCTPYEEFLLSQWYDSFENQPDPLAELRADEREALRALMLENFKKSNVFIDKVAAKTPRGNWIINLVVTVSGIAAALVLVSGVYFYFNKPLFVNRANNITNTVGEEMVLNNQTSSIYKQVLSDGSIVWLSPKSQLTYPRKFFGGLRQVKMEGDAFFEVTKDHSHPFVIYSGGIITRVWGTSFRIRAIKNLSTEVSVVTGRVSVKLPEKDGSEVMLLPKQKVVFHHNNGLLTKSTVTSKTEMRIWQKTSASFDNVPLTEVLNTLKNEYGMRIYTNDTELGKYLLKADFTDQSLPAILEMLQNSLNVNYTMDDTDVVLYRKTSTN